MLKYYLAGNLERMDKIEEADDIVVWGYGLDMIDPHQ
jgi:hypothetical protein